MHALDLNSSQVLTWLTHNSTWALNLIGILYLSFPVCSQEVFHVLTGVPFFRIVSPTPECFYYPLVLGLLFWCDVSINFLKDPVCVLEFSVWGICLPILLWHRLLFSDLFSWVLVVRPLYPIIKPTSTPVFCVLFLCACSVFFRPTPSSLVSLSSQCRL